MEKYTLYINNCRAKSIDDTSDFIKKKDSDVGASPFKFSVFPKKLVHHDREMLEYIAFKCKGDYDHKLLLDKEGCIIVVKQGCVNYYRIQELIDEHKFEYFAIITICKNDTKRRGRDDDEEEESPCKK